MAKSCCEPNLPEPTPTSRKWMKRFWYGILLLIVILLLLAQLFGL